MKIQVCGANEDKEASSLSAHFKVRSQRIANGKINPHRFVSARVLVCFNQLSGSQTARRR
jgi:hypothetical protein